MSSSINLHDIHAASVTIDGANGSSWVRVYILSMDGSETVIILHADSPRHARRIAAGLAVKDQAGR